MQSFVGGAYSCSPVVQWEGSGQANVQQMWRDVTTSLA
jgi:hypothetical protein